MKIKLLLGAAVLAGSGATYQYGGDLMRAVSGDPTTPGSVFGILGTELPLPETLEVQVVDGNNAVVALQTHKFDAGICGQDPRPISSDTSVNPTRVSMDDPFTPGKVCIVPVPTAVPLGPVYRAAALFHGSCSNPDLPDAPTFPCLSQISYSPLFRVEAAPQPDPCLGRVVLDLGDWTRSIPAKGLPRVQFSLLRSASPVVSLVLSSRLRPSGSFITTDEITGSDLKQIAGLYFVLPHTPGSYDIRLEASTTEGCTAGSDRPMIVEVTP